MRTCQQTEGQSVLEHGLSVRRYLFDLLNHLEYGMPLQNTWQLPEWIYTNRDMIISGLPDRRILSAYTCLHDCGKPYCITYDEVGKRHFANHAKTSYEIYLGTWGNQEVADLILHDMDIHLLKAEGVEEFVKSPNWLTHLIVGLAELHSNAQMFGGIESTNFKIKWKAINQRGKRCFELAGHLIEKGVKIV